MYSISTSKYLEYSECSNWNYTLEWSTMDNPLLNFIVIWLVCFKPKLNIIEKNKYQNKFIDSFFSSSLESDMMKLKSPICCYPLVYDEIQERM